jgi:hypothetical protein
LTRLDIPLKNALELTLQLLKLSEIPIQQFGKKKEVKSSQVKLLIINHAFCVVQRATSQSKTGNFRDCGVAEAPPGFQAGWSDCMHFFSLFLFILFAHLEIIQSRHSSP